MEDVIKELVELKSQGYKEVFDDSATFPDGKWLRNFCLNKQKYTPNLVIGCNMRIGTDVNFKMMKKAGFRMVLFGIESANQGSLDRINKGVNADDIIPTIREANSAGLEPHVAVLMGLPWETKEEEFKTIQLVHYLLRRGYAKTAQASLYDVQGEKAIDRNSVGKIYDVWKSPEFWFNKLKDIKSIEDARYLLKSIKKGIIRD